MTKSILRTIVLVQFIHFYQELYLSDFVLASLLIFYQELYLSDFVLASYFSKSAPISICLYS
jgi:hypothetical protein